MPDHNINSLFHIASGDGATKFRPGMTNHYRISIKGLENLIDKTSNSENEALGEDTETILKIASESFKEPTLSQQTVQIKRGNLTMEFPSTIDAFSSTSTWTCFVDSNSYGKLYTWKCKAGDHETGEVGDPADYWKTVKVEHLTGKGEVIGTWTLHNCWISSLEGANFDNNSAAVKTVSVTFKYFKPTYRKA